MTEPTMPVSCQVHGNTESPCIRLAEVEILGVAFCGGCAREQEAYFAIGELVAREEKQGVRSEQLAEALKRIRREQRAVGKEGIGAEAHPGITGLYEIKPLALKAS